jgi:nitric oxide reductase large subunit
MQKARTILSLEPFLVHRFFPLLVFFVIRNHIFKGCDGKNQGLKHILTLLEGVFGTLHHKSWIKNICKPIVMRPQVPC